jgi:tetratricopeptide (TPR) repeat protein
VSASAKPFFVQGLEALKAGDRRRGADLLARELQDGDGSAEALRAVFQLASHISEIDVAIEASRRLIIPGSVGSLASYWSTLAFFGRAAEAVDHIRKQPEAVREHPAALFRLGAAAIEHGRFEEAEDLLHRALSRAPGFAAAWHSLAMIKTFEPDDPDFAAMERLAAGTTEPEAKATILYALGKAREDVGDADEAFRLYSEAGSIRRRLSPPDLENFKQAADAAISGFTAENLARLKPSGFEQQQQRSLFVTGLPRSGTTLTEQILCGHSAVGDGGEVNLFGASVMSTLGIRFDNALAYEQRGATDPWGDIGREYARLLDMRFRRPGLVVDKSLGQSLLIGLLLHTLPDARIASLRRSPEDVALSCFRTQFVGGLSWTSSLTDIADHMAIDDRLFAHWQATFGDRILAVPYENLVRDPEGWATRLQAHFGLKHEDAIHQVSPENRPIKTASVLQARSPITSARIGRAALFERHLEPFRARYYG